MNTSQENAISLEKELAWFGQVLQTRYALYFEPECEYRSVTMFRPPIWLATTRNMAVW